MGKSQVNAASFFPAGMLMRGGRTILQARGETGLAGAFEPAAEGLFADAESGGGGPEGAAVGSEVGDHFGSRQRGESGISVHSVRAGWRAAGRPATTSLHDPTRADNLLKHDT